MKKSEKYFNWMCKSNEVGMTKISINHIKIYGEICSLEGAKIELLDAIYGLESNLLDIPHDKYEKKFALTEIKHNKIRIRELNKLINSY